MQDSFKARVLRRRRCETGVAVPVEAHLLSQPSRYPASNKTTLPDLVIGLPRRHWRTAHGFTLVELLIVLAVLMTITALAVPNLVAAIDSARIAKAVGDIRAMEAEIALYESENGKLPNTLADIGRANFPDPWGTPYQYLNFANAKGKGQMRKDRFLVPINTSYDLYSMGKDRASVPPLTAKVSHDDIIRANDGGYIGLASLY